jgi:glycosyltransferase involved in cell wall biosynthesis
VRIACLSQDPGIAPGRKKGAAVHLAALRGAFRELGHAVVELDEPDSAKMMQQLAEAHARAPIDLVYERYALGADAGSRFSAAVRVPHVLELNAPLALEEQLYRGRVVTAEVCRREAEVLRSARAVVCVSSQVAEYAIERGARPARVFVQPNAVDARLFHPRDAQDALRRELVPAGRIAVGFHGRLRPWHGLELVADAFADLIAQQLDLHFVVAGEGDFQAVFDGRIPAQRVTCVGWQSHTEVARTVACFDVLVLGSVRGQPYYYSPLKLYEAMAAGVVPVVPRAGDLPDLVRDGVEGSCYETGDRADLVRALRPLLADSELRTRAANAARARATKTTWLDVARHVLDSLSQERVPS